MSGRQTIPEDLGAMAPGPGLAGVLAGIDVSRLGGYDCVEVLKAQYRQVNHERARLMAAMVEVGCCGIGPDDALPRVSVPDEFAADEVRAALALTRRAADGQFWTAYDLVTRLPAVHAAMAAGECDEPRARIFSEWTTDLSDQQARALCGRLLPRVRELTTGQLIDQIKKVAIALDPEWARRRYEQAVAGRKVVGHRNPDGSANLSGVNLPVDRVAAAGARIDRLAKGAKREGSSRPIDHLRAELFLGMTDGTYFGLDDEAIIGMLRASPDDDVRVNDECAFTDAGDSGTAGSNCADGAESIADTPDTVERTARGARRGDATATASDTGPCADADDSVRGRTGGGIELRVRVSTLLGRDQYPGELAGWGPVHAELARDLTQHLVRGQWRFVITDTDGHLCHTGLTRARPAGSPRGTDRTRDVVELQVPATLLDRPGPDDELGGWAPVIADLVRHYTRHRKSGSDRFTADAGHRHPGAALRRHLQIRDRRCIGPYCRVPARHTDQDHTLDHARGGPTLADNLGGACRHDHRLKSDGGWTLTQPAPGLFRWVSRLGHSYDIHPPPIIEALPAPIPRGRPPWPVVTHANPGWRDDRILEDPPPEPEPRPRYDPDLDPPPF